MKPVVTEWSGQMASSLVHSRGTKHPQCTDHGTKHPQGRAAWYKQMAAAHLPLCGGDDTYQWVSPYPGASTAQTGSLIEIKVMETNDEGRADG